MVLALWRSGHFFAETNDPEQSAAARSRRALFPLSDESAEGGRGDEGISEGGSTYNCCYNVPPMLRAAMLTWSWLNILSKKRYDALLQLYGSLESALSHVDQPLLRALSCREETVLTVLNRLEEFQPEAYEQELAKRNIGILSIEDAIYPRLLREIADPPVFLYYRGNLEILEQPCVALVGTREMSSYGKRVTELFVPPMVSAGVVTVSGLALGIDAQVARETLMAGGKTVAVLGHGMGSIYPKSNAVLAGEIVAKGGLLLSEFPLDVPPDKFTFPARNRIIAGLSKGTVVLEAGEGSGALITADLALEYGREVFAVPGQIFDENVAGCHACIAQGRAKLVSSGTEVLGDIGIVASEKGAQQVLYFPKSPAEEAVLRVLSGMPQSVSELGERSGLEAASVNVALTMMELAGAAKNAGHGLWVRV